MDNVCQLWVELTNCEVKHHSPKRYEDKKDNLYKLGDNGKQLADPLHMYRFMIRKSLWKSIKLVKRF